MHQLECRRFDIISDNYYVVHSDFSRNWKSIFILDFVYSAIISSTNGLSMITSGVSFSEIKGFFLISVKPKYSITILNIEHRLSISYINWEDVLD